MKTKICIYCGEVLKKSWSSCPNCNTKIVESVPQELPKVNPFQIHYKNQKNRVKSENLREKNLEDDLAKVFGYLALMLGILSLFFGYGIGVYFGLLVGVILEIILAILALIVGGISYRKTEFNKIALTGMILGGLNITLFFYFMPLLWYRF